MIADDRLYSARLFVWATPECFRKGFDDWLGLNWEIYLAIEQQAIAIAKTGRKHHAVNTIIEYLRHYTFLHDAEAEFKMNDKYTSSIARLFVMMNPHYRTLFEFREVSGGVVKKIK